MKKVSDKQGRILDIITIKGLLKTLESLQEMLDKIQRALGDFLEDQRAKFPRFYFVGDEDLLEIIGNTSDIFSV